ncbi:hypothetical protein GCM10009128_06090 [Psychrosphaera haliotis]|uniref:hypothetical protein n=1 Tax=Psychrosphaera haliotis TaxID=555083 RepID=UPI0031E26170
MNIKQKLLEQLVGEVTQTGENIFQIDITEDNLVGKVKIDLNHEIPRLNFTIEGAVDTAMCEMLPRIKSFRNSVGNITRDKFLDKDYPLKIGGKRSKKVS